MNKITILIIILLLGITIFVITKDNDNDYVEETQDEIIVKEVVVNEDQGLEDTEEVLIAGLYAEYAGNLEQYEGNNIVLFFKADWCPSCRALDSNVKSNLDDVPEDLVLLSLNYDTETELKKKYGVTTQHTLVQIDSEGNMIKKWSGGNRLEDVLNQIN